jgi:hypothetical protein
MLQSETTTEASPAGRPGSEPGASLFVWSAWGIMLIVAFIYVARFGPDVPLWDDYAVIPQLSGVQPVTPQWLWSQHSEHRIPLARLILLGTFQMTGANPRAVMFLIVGLLALVAGLLIVAARKALGGSGYSDAFLPIVLLNLGHHENFLWAIQVTYVLPVVLLGIVMALIVRSAHGPGPGGLIVASICLALMPLCNAGGLAFIPAMSLWLWWLAFFSTKPAANSGHPQPPSRSRTLSILALSAPAVVLSVLYFKGYEAPKHHAAPGGPAAAARASVQFLAMALGRPGVVLWPWSGFLVLGLLAGSAGVLAWAWATRSAERARVVGLACILGAVVSLALGTGWGRSGQDLLAGLQPRYTTLAAPALLVAYFVFACHGPRCTRELVPMALFAGSCVLLWPNTADALSAGRKSGVQAAAFDRDLASGTPLFRLVRRYTPFLHPSQEALHESLGMLRQAGIGRYRSLQDDPPFQEIPVDRSPAEVHLARWNQGDVEVTGPDPWLKFDLPSPAPVCGIRLHYSHANPEGAPARFRIAWRRGADRGFPPEQQYANWNLPTGANRSTTIWVDDVVSQFRIQPDNRPCRFSISELTLLVAPGAVIRRR